MSGRLAQMLDEQARLFDCLSERAEQFIREVERAIADAEKPNTPRDCAPRGELSTAITAVLCQPPYGDLVG